MQRGEWRFSRTHDALAPTLAPHVAPWVLPTKKLPGQWHKIFYFRFSQWFCRLMSATSTKKNGITLKNWKQNFFSATGNQPSPLFFAGTADTSSGGKGILNIQAIKQSSRTEGKWSMRKSEITRLVKLSLPLCKTKNKQRCKEEESDNFYFLRIRFREYVILNKGSVYGR